MTSTEPSKIELLRTKIEQRQACEKRTLMSCMQLIDENTVNEQTLIDAAILIDRERYRGVNEDRALKHHCGYPLCPNLLPENTNTNRYHIDVKMNKVIDTTERRLFCSVFCYKASKFFEQQIPQSPVWAREQSDASVKIEILTRENINQKKHDDDSAIISQSVQEIHPRRHSSSSSSSSSDDEFEKLQSARTEYYKSRAHQSTSIDLKMSRISLPDLVRTGDQTIDFVLNCFHEWLTNRTKDYLQTNQSISIESERYQQLVDRIDGQNIDRSRNEGKMPSMDELRKTTGDGRYELKVKEFLLGKGNAREEATTASIVVALPPVDAYSQQTIRLSIVSDKISVCVKQMFADGVGEESAKELRSTLSELLLTFSFGNENIALKPNEWTIMTLILAHSLTLKLPTLISDLSQSKLIGSLLTTLHISSDTMIKTVKYLLDHPIGIEQSSSVSVDFQNIDMILSQRSNQTTIKDLLESEAIDIDKLKQYVQKNSIGTELKPFGWKLLLGVDSPYRATRAYVQQAHCDIYKRLHTTLTTCQVITSATSIQQQFLFMYLLDSHAIRLPIESTKDYDPFISIGKFICSFLNNDNEQQFDVLAECWLITCAMYDKFVRLTRRIHYLRHHVARIAQQAFVHESKLLLHLNAYHIYTCVPEHWLADGFQLITDDISLLNIWEKFIAGSEYIFVFLTIHILHHCRLKLLSFYTTKEIQQYLLDLKIQNQADCEHIVMASIASWKKQGGSLLDFPVLTN